jgi:hypothetical protein
MGLMNLYFVIDADELSEILDIIEAVSQDDALRQWREYFNSETTVLLMQVPD